jgi:hypothetical protein
MAAHQNDVLVAERFGERLAELRISDKQFASAAGFADIEHRDARGQE